MTIMPLNPSKETAGEIVWGIRVPKTLKRQMIVFLIVIVDAFLLLEVKL